MVAIIEGWFWWCDTMFSNAINDVEISQITPTNSRIREFGNILIFIFLQLELYISIQVVF